MQKYKTMETENKHFRDINDNLSVTLNKVKTENEVIINGLKSNLDMKEKEIHRIFDELKNKNNSTTSILEKEKENTMYKINLMQDTINELKGQMFKKTKEFDAMLEDNHKLFNENDNLKRLLRVYKESGEVEVDADRYYNQFDKNRETDLRKKNWNELDANNSKLKNMINQFTTDINNDYRDDSSRDESGLTRGDVSLNRSIDDKYKLPNRSAVIEDIKHKSDSSYILKINS